MLKPMLMRLQTALGCDDLVSQIVLLPGSKTSLLPDEMTQRPVNLVVGYSGSNNSQAALDLALWIGHQTRLVSLKPVLVHVVYVVDQTRPKTIENADRILWQARCLASEWRGSLNAHLRIGHVATELSLAAQETQAEIMLVGCRTSQHGLIQQLADEAPCPVLGLPCLPQRQANLSLQR